MQFDKLPILHGRLYRCLYIFFSNQLRIQENTTTTKSLEHTEVHFQLQSKQQLSDVVTLGNIHIVYYI